MMHVLFIPIRIPYFKECIAPACYRLFVVDINIGTFVMLIKKKEFYH